MTVQEMIDILSKVEDKTLDVVVTHGDGWSYDIDGEYTEELCLGGRIIDTNALKLNEEDSRPNCVRFYL